jgi:hypothetical protein
VSCFAQCLLFLYVLAEYVVLTLVASMFLGTIEDDMHGTSGVAHPHVSAHNFHTIHHFIHKLV